jgi:hypothetical protein
VDGGGEEINEAPEWDEFAFEISPSVPFVPWAVTQFNTRVFGKTPV